MRKIILNIIALLLLSFSSLQAVNPFPTVEKMHERKWQMMMSQVKLTDQEMAAVKPIFMEYEQAMWKIHQDRGENFKNMKKHKLKKDIDYNYLNNKYVNSEIKQAQLLREYHLRLKKVLDPETLFHYYQAERMFKRQLLREMPPPPPENDRQ